VIIHTTREATTINISTVGIDLAKNVFQIHGANERGKKLWNKQLQRKQVLKFFTRLPPCLIGMEACGSAHFWARKLEELGHTVKLMAPQFVKPYVKTNKNDAADAEAYSYGSECTQSDHEFYCTRCPSIDNFFL